MRWQPRTHGPGTSQKRKSTPAPPGRRPLPAVRPNWWSVSIRTSRVWRSGDERSNMKRRLVCLALAGLAAHSISATRAGMFHDIAVEAGLTFHHVTGAAGDYFMPEIMGSGAALLDYDNDDDLDVFLIQGTTLDPDKKPLFPPPAGLKPGNRLFQNMLSQTGKLQFV